MIIALDFDQTYTADPTLWKGFVKHAQLRGHTVLCVTCRPEYDVSGTQELMEIIGKGNFYFTDNEMKMDYMEDRSHVDIWIDDTPATVCGGRTMYKKK